ncbi:inhibitor of growth protein 4-like protein [Dinothrombium tinctorium]|uniref:Inhibitor of growth protein n=1 Tax=Dinothrombium tinctorium TaxID=1965070 RepID=A0A443R948_9ACAR|nr:inhibitor of growth protein 4-like protein [Dinothrombium tinctorium]
MSVPYLEYFLDTLEPLPGDLQRNFTLMRDLDIKTQDLIKKIKDESEEYLNVINQMSANEKCEKFRDIHDMFEKAKVLSDEKVQLSMQTYEMVDKHIRRLDAELTKLEADLKDKALNNTAMPEEQKKKGRGGGRDKGKAAFNPKNVIKEETDKGRRKQKTLNETNVANVSSSSALSITGSNEVLDMPVDPNEPTYCLCHQVSYGEMIGCDNPDCPIEWFHFGCVGLTMKPKGKWFCPKCIVERKKK